MLNKILCLVIGGSIGTLLRYLVNISCATYTLGNFPWGTFLVNMLGAFLIGLGYAYFTHSPLPEPWRLFLFVGLFGSFTTFSTFMFEGVDMIRTGALKMAFIYLLSSNVLGLCLVFFGIHLGDKINTML